MAGSSLREVALAGIYTTRQARVIDDASPFELTWEAINGALVDARLGIDDVDGAAITFTGPGGVDGDAGSWARLFGHPVRFIADGLLDTAGARGVLKAAAAIAAGLCDVAVVGGASASGAGVPGGGLRSFGPDTARTTARVGPRGGGGPVGGCTA